MKRFTKIYVFSVILFIVLSSSVYMIDAADLCFKLKQANLDGTAMRFYLYTTETTSSNYFNLNGTANTAGGNVFIFSGTAGIVNNIGMITLNGSGFYFDDSGNKLPVFYDYYVEFDEDYGAGKYRGYLQAFRGTEKFTRNKLELLECP